MPFWSEKKRSSKSSSSKHSHSKSGSSQHGSSSQRQEIDVPENGFDLTNNDGTIHVLPKQLRRAKCATIYVEFLFTPNSNPDSPDYDHANHVIIKIDFATTVGKYAGVRISMDVDYDYEEYVNDDNVCLKHGCLYVRPVEYLGISYSSSRTLQIGLGRLETPELSALLSPIMENRMQVFSFDCSRDQYQGCKQWVYVSKIDSFSQHLWLYSISTNPSRTQGPVSSCCGNTADSYGMRSKRPIPKVSSCPSVARTYTELSGFST